MKYIGFKRPSLEARFSLAVPHFAVMAALVLLPPSALAQTSAVGANDLLPAGVAGNAPAATGTGGSGITVLDSAPLSEGGGASVSPPGQSQLRPQAIDGSSVPPPQAPPDAMIAPVTPMVLPKALPEHSGQYYDSMTTVDEDALRNSSSISPRKMDPVNSPGQRYVIVESVGSASSLEAQYTSANRALKLGRYAAAMEIFERLYRENPKDVRILMGLGVAQQGAGFLESAATTYEELLAIQPDHSDAIVNLMGLMRGQYPSVTLSRLVELRTKYPHNPGIPAQIGFINAEMRNYEDAIRYFEVAASMEPSNPMHVFNMAITYDKAGNAGKAVEYYERALQLDATAGMAANKLPREQVYDRLSTLRRNS